MTALRAAAIVTVALASLPSSAFAAARHVAGIVADVPTGWHARPSAAASAGGLPYEGGRVLHSNRAHVIFWQPSNSLLSFDPGYESVIERFFSDVAADSHRPTNVYGLTGQYGDRSGRAVYQSTFAGAVLDSDPLPSNGCSEPLVSGPHWFVCLTDDQLQTEIDHVVRAEHLPARLNDIYFLVTPNGFGSCISSQSDECALGGSGSGYCGYHSQTYARILYAVIPYNAVQGHCQSGNPRPNSSTADPAISTISHEHNEMITDPTGLAWIDASNNEDGDLCITQFKPYIGGSGAGAWNQDIHGGHYDLQREWSNEDGTCEARDESNPTWFIAPAHTAAAKLVRVRAHASDPDGAIVTYNWWFGDSARSHRRSAKHAYRRPGTYTIVLRTTDRAGNWSFYSRTLKVTKARARTLKRQ